MNETIDNPRVLFHKQLWFTPVIALLTFALGMATGYLIRPQMEPNSPDSEVVAAPAQSGATPGQNGNQEVMSYLIEETRHFKGDPNAPVTLIEFSDFK